MRINKVHGGYKKTYSSAEYNAFMNKYAEELMQIEKLLNDLDTLLDTGIIIGFSLEYDGELKVNDGVIVGKDGIDYFAPNEYDCTLRSGDYVILDRETLEIEITRQPKSYALGMYDGSGFDYSCRKRSIWIEGRNPIFNQPFRATVIASADDLDAVETPVAYVSSEKRFYIDAGEWQPVSVSNVIGGL